MELKRFFLTSLEGTTATLTGEEFYHCVKVTRHKEGFLFVGCTGDGFDYTCRIVSIHPDRLIAEVLEREPNRTEPEGNVVLLQGLCKEFDFICQKAVELGVTEIVPFTSVRSNVDKFRRERLEKIIRDAAKQCGRAIVPFLRDPCDFGDAVRRIPDAYQKIMCYEEEVATPLVSAVDDRKNLAMVIGSEGGFEAGEADLAREYGFTTVSLGKRILRAETAAVAALTLAMNALGEL